MPPQLSLFCTGPHIKDKRGNCYSLVIGNQIICEMCEEASSVGYMTRTSVRSEFICNRCTRIVAGNYYPHVLFQKKGKRVWTGSSWSFLLYEAQIYNNKIDAKTDWRISFGRGKHISVVALENLEEAAKNDDDNVTPGSEHQVRSARRT